MNTSGDSALDLVEKLKRKAPEYLDLLTAGSDDEFEDAFDGFLEQAVKSLEKNKKNFHGLDEEGLSAALAMALSMPGLSVTQETNSNGHVDLTIDVSYCVPARTKLGEAKIYGGPAYHVSGLKQLLNRYTTGREGRGWLIVYVQKRGIENLVKKLRRTLDKDLPAGQKNKTTDHRLRWSFLSTHSHSCGEDLQVGHIGCNLYIDS